MLLGQLVSGGEREREGLCAKERDVASVEEEAEICTSSACEVVAHAACPFQSDAADGQEREEEAMDSRLGHAPNYL